MTSNSLSPKIPDTLAVFSPTPLLTVTIEARSDGRPELHVHAGGQGFWVARMVARLGVPVTLCVPLGGDTGRLLKTLIADEQVQICATEMAGVNGAYVHDRRGGERVEVCQVDGSRLNRHEQDDLYNATFAAAMNARLLVLTGQYPSAVVPPTVYQRLGRDLKQNGRQVIADLSGDELSEALQGGVDVLCVSHEELVELGYASSGEPKDLMKGLGTLRRRGATQIILHRGAEPTIALLDDRFLEVTTPQVTPLDHRGGGDTFFAALAVGLIQQADLVETLRFAAAAGTLNVTRHGLGTGRLEDIAALSAHVQIRPLS